MILFVSKRKNSVATLLLFSRSNAALFLSAPSLKSLLNICTFTTKGKVKSSKR